MLPATVRRAAAPAVASLANVAPKAAAVTVNMARTPFRHQRRCSSSKPSSSDNGPKDIPGQSAAAVPATTARAGETKGPEKRKRRTKDAREAASHKLPSVPSTQHLSQEALGLSTFFSLHRPISVTSSMPKSITDDAFAAIFDLGTRPSTKDVISTLSRTADDLEGAMASMTIGSEAEADANGDPVRKVDFQHADGSESSVYVQLNAMAGQFVPFRPPPAPEAQSSSTMSQQTEQQLLGETTAVDPHHRVYKALFTIEESTDPDGQIRVVAHSPRIVRGDGRPRTFLERMARRQLMFDDAQAHHAGPTMQAISVRRQRKLKMKKQKYKKLMKRTRNLRRKLDRL
ncbi:hypothetical protein F5X68DRAFT_211706 [Plectosphaerella plurivora]|uniref:Small ribosomal subunit protein mS38 n=1 Tax=Plectosphaerella plurivora TaxID=936078 RepID=A0A9P8V515_9PEZI|nr:hypothetical protein F5X68DRAFT_211706 [Plectosphaerella plurivora]